MAAEKGKVKRPSSPEIRAMAAIDRELESLAKADGGDAAIARVLAWINGRYGDCSKPDCEANG